MDLKESKKKVIEDWQNAFFNLIKFAPNKFYKIVGCTIIGIELIKLPNMEKYRPYFVLYGLWKKDIKECLNFPILMNEFYNKRQLQYDIPYDNHTILFNEIVETIKVQSPLTFEGDISLKKMFSVIEEYYKNPKFGIAHNSYLNAVLMEDKLKIALYKSEKVDDIIQSIRKKEWDLNHFKACKIDVNIWFKSLEEIINNREEFLKQIETNKQDIKLAKLNISDIYK